ncbi:biosynthesis protein PigD [Hahella sp. NBU794]|uniref:biosynthesis protein PigD n=1 Tax=Hahella sp. NBU794 TaxID=3422590 RepID=UPI003D6F6370
MEITIGVIVVTRSRGFFETGLSVLSDIRGEVFQQVSLDADIEFEEKLPSTHPVYEEARDKAVRFLGKRKERISMRVIQADSLERAQAKILQTPLLGVNFQVGMVYVDYADPQFEDLAPQQIDRQLQAFYAALRQADIPVFQSSFSTVVYTLPQRPRIRHQPMEYIERQLPDDRSLLQADLLCLWMDFFEMSYANRRVKPAARVLPHNTLGEHLINFLSARAGSEWLGFYFTGSLVSNMINHLEQEAERRNVLLLRGPSEHSLACGAMANWQLYRRPFLIVVTSGMIDEFKGTIANLREARAQGFIVCAENRHDQWFAFQGTVSAEEDSREVIKARGLPCLYLNDVDRLQEDLQKAMELYNAKRGPVVLLATQAVLEACSRFDIAYPPAPQAPADAIPESVQPVLDQVMSLLNEGPDKLVWQCGAMDEEELELTLSIADRAGIALVDSLTYPGSVPKFRHCQRNRNYLGTLAVYGYSPRVYNFLHTNDKMNPQSEQCLFFIKSKLHQVCTPFSDGRLQRKLQIVQLTENPEHISPYTDFPLMLEHKQFLRYVDKHLAPSPELVARRYQAIASVPDTPSDMASRLPTTPMTPNYFFARLNKLMEKLIVEHGYDYTGLYDVGRCGISAVRNLARTRRGFSGWYGRALMGDALMASISLAFTSPSNVVAFIGDGAKGLTPDVLPSLLENALSYPGRMNRNLTIFYFCNGGHSVINTYQERILFNYTSRQMRLVNVTDQDWEDELGGLRFTSRTLTTFDPAALTSALLRPGCVNLFSVMVSHNNEGDGISLATATGWQRDPAVQTQAEAKAETATGTDTETDKESAQPVV